MVDGIEDVQPAVSGTRQRILIVRDQSVPGGPTPQGSVPSWDVSLNYVPITSPTDPNSSKFVRAAAAGKAAPAKSAARAAETAPNTLEVAD